MVMCLVILRLERISGCLRASLQAELASQGWERWDEGPFIPLHENLPASGRVASLGNDAMSRL